MSDISPPQPEMPATARPDVDPQSVEGLFLTVLAMESPAERAAFLDQICGNDAPRRRRIEALLRAYDDAGSFLEHPATPVGVADNFDFLQPADKPGCLGRLGHYEVIDVIGRGGMGIVFRALDPRLNRIVAVKVLAPELAANPLARRRFLREAQAAAAVSHPHVVTIHAVDEAKLPYLVMECIVGQSLQQKLDQVGPLRLTEILRIGSQIAEGLAAAHRQGLIHRDIKPANILLENGVERVKITDFGLARAADDAAITRTGEVSGTPQYMSPEQAHGDKVDPRSDLFSLGCVLYAMCTGRSPFRADSVAAAIRRVCDDTPRPIAEINAEIPAWLIDLIDILLAKQPEDRFQTADEVAVALEKCLVRVQRPGDSSPPTASRIEEPRHMPANAAVAPSSYGLSDVTYASGTAAIVLFLGQVLFAGAFGLVGGLEIQSCYFDLPDPKLFMARLSGALGAIFLLSTVGLWLNPATSGGRSVALTIATRFAIFYAMWFGLFTSVVVIGEWNTQEDEPLLVVLGVIGLSIVAGTAFLLGRATSSGTEPATEPRTAGRHLALLGIGVWALLLTWFLGIAIGVLRPPRFESPLHTAAGPLGIGLVWTGGLLLAAGMFLQNRILGAAHWLYVLRIVGLGALMVGGLLAILSLLYFFGEAITPSPLELIIVLVVVALAILMYRRIGRTPPSTGDTGADAARCETPARHNRNWLWTALIVFSIVCVAPCLLGVAYLSLSYSTVEVQRMAAPTTPQTSAAPSDAAGEHGGGGAAMMGMPGMDGGYGGSMGSMMDGGSYAGTFDESQWGAILLDVGTVPSSPPGMPPGGMMGMAPGGAFSHLMDRAVRLRPTDTVPGRIAEKDAPVRKNGETVYHAHPLTDPGIYRIAPGEYEVQLFDWSYGWALGRDVAETASYTPVAPQRPAAVRSLGTIRVQTGEIVTVSATRDDVSALLRGILATTPDMHETQLAQFVWNGEMFVLSPQQAKVVRYLLQRSAAGEAETTEAELRTGAGQQLTFIRKSDSGEPETQIVPVDSPIEQIFNNGRHPAWGTLIVPGTQAGTFALGPLKLPQGTVPAVAVPEEATDSPASAAEVPAEPSPDAPADALNAMETSAALELIRHVREARQAIRSGRATITVEDRPRLRGNEVALLEAREAIVGTPGWKRRASLAFLGNKIRCDDENGRQIINGQSYLRCDRETTTGADIKVSPLKDSENQVADLRVWGMSPRPLAILRNGSVAKFAQVRGNRPEFAQSKVDADGSHLQLLRTAGEDVTLSFWIDPQRGWNIVRATAEGPNPRGGMLDDTIECQLAPFEGVWFPKEVKYTRQVDGVLAVEEVSTISDVHFNEELPDELFEEEGMSMSIEEFLKSRAAEATEPAVR